MRLSDFEYFHKLKLKDVLGSVGNADVVHISESSKDRKITIAAYAENVQEIEIEILEKFNPFQGELSDA